MEDGIDETGRKVRLLISFRSFYLFNVHLDLTVRVFVSQLLEPKVIRSAARVDLVSCVDVLDVFIDHLLRDFEAFRDLDTWR